MPIKEQIKSIITARQKDMRPRYQKLWEASIPYVRLAYGLRNLIYCDVKHSTINEDFKLLLKSNKELESLFQQANPKIKKFIEEVLNNVGAIDLKDDQEIEIPMGIFDAVYHRINKSDVEICIMGPVSTGKSVLMRGLTGAPNYVLPTGSAKTTATRTVFRNIPDSDEKKAEINFYTIKEFQEIINDFIINFNKILKADNQQELPIWNGNNESITDFCRNLTTHESFNINNFDNKQIPGIDTKIGSKEYFSTFRDLYVDKVSDYADFLGYNPVSLNSSQIDNHDLVPYVSYKRRITDKEVTSCLALAVKEVVIDWPLRTSNNEDLGKISLVDTMGIGEPKFSVESSLLNIIRQRADLAIALCKIENNNDDFDSKHDSDKKFLGVLSHLKERKPESWVYYLANKQSGAGIKEATISDFREKLWKYISSGSDGFSLNERHWSAFEFINNSQAEAVNRDEILRYLETQVLAHLKNDIEKIDAEFIQQAHSSLDQVVESYKEILTFLHMLKNISLDISDGESYAIKRSDEVMQSIKDRLIELRDKISSENDKHCQEILNNVYPLLAEPELFKLYGIKLEQGGDNNLFLLDEKSSKVKSIPMIAKVEDRERLVFIILTQLNYYRARSDKHNASYAEAKEYVLQQFEEKESYKPYFEQLKQIMDLNFFKVVYDETGRCIKEKIKNSINHQTQRYDEENKKIYKNELGRELQFFYELREDLLFGILGRLDTDDKKNADTYLTKYFKDETIKVIKRVCGTIKKTFEENRLDVNTYIAEEVAWFKALAETSKSKQLCAAINEFLCTTIKLNDIVTDQQANKLLDNLNLIELKYNNPEDAAYSFFACLFFIDRQLRYTLWRMYVDTFNNYGIYNPALSKLYNSVFCAYQKEKDPEYWAFLTIIRKALLEQFENSDEGKISRAKVKLDKCLESVE